MSCLIKHVATTVHQFWEKVYIWDSVSVGLRFKCKNGPLNY